MAGSWRREMELHPGGIPKAPLGRRSPFQENALEYADLLWKYGPESDQARSYAKSLPDQALDFLFQVLEVWLGIQEDPESVRIVETYKRRRHDRRVYRERKTGK